MSITPAEREITLSYDEESDMYHIFCSSPKERTRMKRAGFTPYKTDEEGNTYYKVDRNQISFRAKSKPRQKREMTEEHKQKLLKGLEKARKNKGKSGDTNV